MSGNPISVVKAAASSAPAEGGWARGQLPGDVAEVARLMAQQGANDAAELSPSSRESFGARLRRLRLKKRLSQMRLAVALDVSVPAVSAWEKDRARPKHGRLAALGHVLDVSVSELLGNDVPEFSPDMLAESRAQIARIVGTTPDKVRILIEF